MINVSPDICGVCHCISFVSVWVCAETTTQCLFNSTCFSGPLHRTARGLFIKLHTWDRQTSWPLTGCLHERELRHWLQWRDDIWRLFLLYSLLHTGGWLLCSHKLVCYYVENSTYKSDNVVWPTTVEWEILKFTAQVKRFWNLQFLMFVEIFLPVCVCFHAEGMVAAASGCFFFTTRWGVEDGSVQCQPLTALKLWSTHLSESRFLITYWYIMSHWSLRRVLSGRIMTHKSGFMKVILKYLIMWH